MFVCLCLCVYVVIIIIIISSSSSSSSIKEKELQKHTAELHLFARPRSLPGGGEGARSTLNSLAPKRVSENG